VALAFIGSAILFYALYARLPVLYDADAYYHLAVARDCAERGIPERLEWARFSLLHDGFGDKELLFHLLLAPFAALRDATTGGVIALALLNAVVVAALTHAGLRTMGYWGIAVPLLVFGTAIDFTLRTIRLRPELLSLILILAAIPLAARGRVILLGVVACAYALGYTAFHALLGLVVLFAAVVLWQERRLEGRLVLAALVGVVLGLVLHPHFPTNLRVWAVQNVQFFVHDALPDVGREIRSRTTSDTLVLNLGWWAALLVLWRSREPVRAPATDTRLGDFTLVATVVFGVLYLLMARFILYLVPLATLALLRSMAARGEAPGGPVRLPWRGRVPFALAMTLCLLSALPLGYLGWTRMKASVRDFGPHLRADREAFAAAMPDGAKVAAPWAATESFVFWAPRARYLNVLDPIFMVAKDAALYRAYLDLFEGREPDVPLVARTRFDSDFYADDGQYPFARARLLQDPRIIPLHDGSSYLYRFQPGRNGDFLLDWKVLPITAPAPPPLAMLVDPSTPSYPRAVVPEERALEGYVDGRRLGPADACRTFARVEERTEPVHMLVEVAPYGTAEVFVDDRLAAAIPSPRAAVLGRGVILPLALDPGLHRITVRTCPTESHLGFYALVRDRQP
jgi:hypothetical protein